MFAKILIFLLIAGIVFLVIRFRFQIHSFTGDISFFEKYFGTTENGIVIFAIFIFIMGLIYSFGSLDKIIINIFGNFF